VGDGICDCCDGSDEANENYETLCPDTCLESKTNPLLFINEIEEIYKKVKYELIIIEIIYLF
jgi:hypothetical protein